MTHAPEKSFWKRIPRKWLFIFLYALIVCASNAWRKNHPYEAAPAKDQTVVAVREFDDDFRPDQQDFEPTGENIRIALRDIPADDAHAPTLLLLHGTPGGSEKLAGLVDSLRGKFRLLVPDLPGAGASEREVQDYSITATAFEMRDLLDKMHVAKVHVVGVGLGGGVALKLSRIAPERVSSLALLSSVGAQEFDLLGNNVVNKLVYGIHEGVFKAARYLTPNFGLLDRFPMNADYARGLRESNFAKLAQNTRDWRGPLFFAHGEEDWLVAPDTARYGIALSPKAESLFVPGGHDVFLKHPETVAGALGDFVTRADAGAIAPTPKPDETAPMPKPPMAKGSRHFVLMGIILLCTLVAEDPTCLATGLLVGLGLIDFWSGTLACLIGIFMGDLFLYLVGRVLGHAALRKAPFKWMISEYAVDRMSTRFGSTQGMAVIVTSRFIPGSRVPTFVSAGIMKLNPAKLGLLFFVAAALWTPPLVLIAEHAGGNVTDTFEKFHKQAGWIAIGLILAIFVTFHYITPAFTWLGRRQLLAKMRGVTNHALMPGWLLKLPGALHVAGLWIRFGGPSVYAAANPGLGRLGGASGDSKAALLAPFAEDLSVAPYLLVPHGAPAPERARAAKEFLAQKTISYPVVIKPDGAENGVGVFVADNEERLDAWFAAFDDDALVQPYYSGREYEVVWHRAPGETRGRILAVVEKRRTHVTGDGKHRLEHLIWASDEAIDHAELFVRLNAGREDTVPAAGETVRLCEIGSLAKGARVSLRHGLDAAPAANAALNALAARHQHAHWLRLDIRAESDEAFAAAEGWRITEIEGAGKLSSLLRDPDIRPADAHLRLAAQRKAMFAAGAANLASGAASATPSVFDLVATWSEAHETKEPPVHPPAAI